MPKEKSKKVSISLDSAVTNVKGVQKKKSDKKRVSNSNFIVLINPNRRIGQFDEELEPFCEALKNAIDGIIYDIGNYLIIEEEGHEYNTKYFKKVEAKQRIERGDVQNRPHSHTMICIAHYSRIKLDVGKIRQTIIDECPGVKNPFIRVKISRGSAKSDLERFEDYINKNM